MQRFYFNKEDSTSYPVFFITHENETMVKAIDISNMVGIKNMRHAIRLFDESEKKQVEKAYFLTMKGIIKIFCISKKNTNEAFPKWINSVINDSVNGYSKYSNIRSQIKYIEGKIQTFKMFKTSLPRPKPLQTNTTLAR